MTRKSAGEQHAQNSDSLSPSQLFFASARPCTMEICSTIRPRILWHMLEGGGYDGSPQGLCGDKGLLVPKRKCAGVHASPRSHEFDTTYPLRIQLGVRRQQGGSLCEIL